MGRKSRRELVAASPRGANVLALEAFAVRLDNLTNAQLQAYRDALNTYITTGVFPGGAQSYTVQGRTVSRIPLDEALRTLNDVMAAIARKTDDSLGIALVELGDP